MSKIIAFSGRKQSGKTTGAEYILSLFPKEFCKIYNFADPLKQDICINILGLTYEQCYGDDDTKNSLTDIRWEDMPGVICPPTYVSCGAFEGTNYNDINLKDIGLMEHTTGFMTAREVMEYVGTSIFRKIKSKVWVDTTIKKIISENYPLAIITDCRFSNEVEPVLNEQGLVIRLTRDPFNSIAESETALDRCRYDWSRFSLVIDNHSMNIEDKNKEIYKFLHQHNYSIQGIE
jgi:hypothetical protein